jgi:hypothetical protein
VGHGLRERALGAKLARADVRRTDMLGERDGEVELECPECGASVRTTVKAAEKGKVRCPRGHEFDVMGALGGLLDSPARGKQ